MWWQWAQRAAAILFIPLLVTLMLQYWGGNETGIGTNHGSENKSWDDDLIDPARWYACLPEFRSQH